jgi:PPOX class probable F420-dependent enzyme
MDDRLLALLGERHQGVLTTLKRDGRPQLSNVSYTFASGVVRVSVTAGRAKTKNLLRDPRASFYACAPDFRAYVVAEGVASLSAVAAAADDPAVEELVDVYRAIAGEHPDWDEYRAVMVAEQRMVVRIPVDRVYGMA